MKSKKIDPDTHFRVLHNLEDNPSLSQRDLAKILGISLGAVNYCLKALIEVGHIKAQNFKKNPNKFEYLYILTPSGIRKKTLLTGDFLKRKMKEYEDLKNEIEGVKFKSLNINLNSKLLKKNGGKSSGIN